MGFFKKAKKKTKKIGKTTNNKVIKPTGNVVNKEVIKPTNNNVFKPVVETVAKPTGNLITDIVKDPIGVLKDPIKFITGGDKNEINVKDIEYNYSGGVEAFSGDLEEIKEELLEMDYEEAQELFGDSVDKTQIEYKNVIYSFEDIIDDINGFNDIAKRNDFNLGKITMDGKYIEELKKGKWKNPPKGNIVKRLFKSLLDLIDTILKMINSLMSFNELLLLLPLFLVIFTIINIILSLN